MKSYSFLFWAYNVIWLCIAGYLMFVAGRVKRLDRRIDAAQRHLSREETTAPRGDAQRSGDS